MRTKTAILLLSAAVLLPTDVFPQEPTEIPTWFVEHIDFMTRDGGRWIASNAGYQNDNEPFDAYGLEWQEGLGGLSLRGRLYGLQDGVEAATFWEFRSVWHPGEQRVMAFQFGADGTYGAGTMVSTGDSRHRTEQEFFSPQGSGSRVGHEALDLSADRHETGSFDILPDGSWKTRRSYVWERSTD